MKRKTSLPSVTFWGTRGSIATPGRSTLHYGGNTSCVEIEDGKGGRILLDAGTGIRALGRDLVKKGLSKTPKEGIALFISHTHLDHIGGLPFFAPALKRDQKLILYGPPGLEEALRGLFPFPILPCEKKIIELETSTTIRAGSFRVQCQWVNHPGGAFGYRITSQAGRIVTYISDHEPAQKFRHNQKMASDEALASWIRGTDLLIMDAQYFDHEYEERCGWGHSSVSDTINMATRAGVGRLVFFHHDPSHSDKTLERKLSLAKKMTARSKKPLVCSLAREGGRIVL